MTDATRLIWTLAGAPEPAAASLNRHLTDTAGDCSICGHRADRTARSDQALGTNFTDWGHLTKHTNLVCAACLWCCSGKPPATLRMWSVVASEDTARIPASDPKAWLQSTPGLCLYNRSRPGILTRLLADPPARPWVASVALSGQKHVLPYAHINTGYRWTVRVEDHSVTSDPTEWVAVHHSAMELRRLGIPADAVLNGTPDRIRTRADLDAWKEHNDQLGPYHRSPLLSLALWTITKETMT